MGITLIDQVTGGIAKVVKHPVRTASYGVGLVRGVATSMLRALSGTAGLADAERAEAPQRSTDEGPEVVPPTPLFPPPAPQQRPTAPPPAFVTEPTAVTRDSAHGRGAADADVDDWYGEQDADRTPSGVVEALEFGDRLTPEEADIKAILSEADLLRRAGERPGEQAEERPGSDSGERD